tara:strand:+ start:127 stop:429 length:303 start_codon:yes stop_codon:yes gene_type:complete
MNPDSTPVKLFQFVIKIATATADPRLGYAELGPSLSDSTMILGLGRASAYNDLVVRGSPPWEIPQNFELRIHGFVGAVGVDVGCQIETDNGLNYLGVQQF